MKSRKISLFCLLSLALFVLFACERIYPDGETEEVSWVQATADVFMGNPPRDKVDLKKPKVLTGDEKKDEEIKKHNEEVAAHNEKAEKHNKGAEEDRKNPDTGLLVLLGTIAAASSFGHIKGFLNKKALEGVRDVFEEENVVLKGRYQEIKEGLRDDVPMLEKVKRLASTGADVARDQMKILKNHSDDISTFKEAYKEYRKVS